MIDNVGWCWRIQHCKIMQHAFPPFFYAMIGHGFAPESSQQRYAHLPLASWELALETHTWTWYVNIYIYIKCVLNPASVTNVCHPNKTSPCSCKHFAQSCSALDCGGNGWWWDWWADHHPSSEDENLSNSVRVWSVYKTNQWQTPRIYMFIVIT